MPPINIALVVISSPILVGVYDSKPPYHLIEIVKTAKAYQDGKLSDILAHIFEGLLARYELVHIVYTNTPGNFLSIKLAYIFLKTLSLCYPITIKSIDGFYFNEGKAIKAILGQCFIKQEGRIKMVAPKHGELIGDELMSTAFKLPGQLPPHDFSDDILPQYVSPAVY